MQAQDARFASYARRSVCVTGGAGFIGSHLVDALLRTGARVTVIDDLSGGRRGNLPATGVRFIRGSVLSPEALATATEGAEIVFHLAAVPSVPRSVAEPLHSWHANADGTLAVLEAVRRSGARCIYAASSSAYGDRPGLPRVETFPPDPRSPYAAAKLAGEHLVRAYAACYDLEAVSLRYFNIFGPRQRPDSAYAAVIPRFIRQVLDGGRPVIFGDGLQTRDFTFVANAVHANLLAGLATGPLDGRVINVASGERRSLRELVRAIGEIMGVPIEPAFAPARTGEVQHSLADLSRARERLGYTPIVSFEAGLAGTVEWLRGQGDGGGAAPGA